MGYSTFYKFINIDNRFLHLNSPFKTPGVSNFANLGMSQPLSVNQPARQERPERTSPYPGPKPNNSIATQVYCPQIQLLPLGGDISDDQRRSVAE